MALPLPLPLPLPLNVPYYKITNADVPAS